MSLEKKSNIKYLINDDSDEEIENVFENNSSESDSVDDENTEIIDTKKDLSNTEINFEIIKNENKEKSVKISINLNLEESDEVVSLEFNISKKVFLKIANDLNNKK